MTRSIRERSEPKKFLVKANTKGNTDIRNRDKLMRADLAEALREIDSVERGKVSSKSRCLSGVSRKVRVEMRELKIPTHMSKVKEPLRIYCEVSSPKDS